ncbi:MAG: superoxide dismutase copper/zinc binding protein [Paenibacillus sp.]|nr:superoxide dismutase copper/zinc binding protein [Paenibacillus sp.]
MNKQGVGAKTAAAAFLCGSIFFSGLGFAADRHAEISTEKLFFFVKGRNATSGDGSFDNGGTRVPEAFIYEGTTYIPVRKAAELLGEPVYWDGAAKSISIGLPSATLVNANGEPVGQATFTAEAGGVTVRIQASDLAPGKHGVHIHEKAITGFDFKTAGGHFNPGGKKHGHASPGGHHAGDLGNLEAGADGKATGEIRIPGSTLAKGDPHSLLGKSIVIHAKEDDEKTDPAGDSGDRIAGGNIPE